VTKKYECHITCPLGYEIQCETVAKLAGWETSKIDGDPLLGEKVFFYLTTHSDDWRWIHDKMRETVRALIHFKVPVLREKIEEIVHDVRYTEPSR
jgi:hypothetical protein